jgi:hypothetical protein
MRSFLNKILFPVRCLRFDESTIRENLTKKDMQEIQQAPKVRCAACQNILSDPSKGIAVSGSHQHSFTNPLGIVYDIAIYQEVSCLLHGPASDEHTWFRGYTWQIALCPQCHDHIGWYFHNLDANAFYGLILSKIVIE